MCTCVRTWESGGKEESETDSATLIDFIWDEGRGVCVLKICVECTENG